MESPSSVPGWPVIRDFGQLCEHDPADPAYLLVPSPLVHPLGLLLETLKRPGRDFRELLLPLAEAFSRGAGDEPFDDAPLQDLADADLEPLVLEGDDGDPAPTDAIAAPDEDPANFDLNDMSLEARAELLQCLSDDARIGQLEDPLEARWHDMTDGLTGWEPPGPLFADVYDEARLELEHGGLRDE
jgi:hypothetical protein